MLVLSETAAEVVKSLTGTPQAPEGAGLRIAPSTTDSADPDTMQLMAAAGPGDEDQVVEADGARVYLDPHAVAYLDDKVLDAQVDGAGNAQFSLRMQHPGQA